jgi:hypothetical protein
VNLVTSQGLEGAAEVLREGSGSRTGWVVQPDDERDAVVLDPMACSFDENLAVSHNFIAFPLQAGVACYPPASGAGRNVAGSEHSKQSEQRPKRVK